MSRKSPQRLPSKARFGCVFDALLCSAQGDKQNKLDCTLPLLFGSSWQFGV
jgi:hypothetical protein